MTSALLGRKGSIKNVSACSIRYAARVTMRNQTVKQAKRLRMRSQGGFPVNQQTGNFVRCDSDAAANVDDIIYWNAADISSKR